MQFSTPAKCPAPWTQQPPLPPQHHPSRQPRLHAEGLRFQTAQPRSAAGFPPAAARCLLTTCPRLENIFSKWSSLMTISVSWLGDQEYELWGGNNVCKKGRSPSLECGCWLRNTFRPISKASGTDSPSRTHSFLAGGVTPDLGNAAGQIRNLTQGTHGKQGKN